MSDLNDASIGIELDNDGVEPFSDMTAIGEPDGIGRARRAIREWVYRAAPFTSPQLQDMLDTIAECPPLVTDRK